MKKNDIEKILNQQYVQNLFKKRIDHYFPSFGSKKINRVKIERVSPEWAKKSCLARYEIIFSDKTKKTIRASAGINDSKRRTFEINSFLYHCGFNIGKFQVPKPLDYIKEAGAFLYEEADGSPLAQLLEKDKCSFSLFEDLANFLFKLHSLSPKKIKKRAIVIGLKNYRKFFRKIEKLFPQISPYIIPEEKIRFIKKLNDNSVFLHGDFYPGNILIGKRRKITLIDFDRAGLGPAVLDVAALSASLNLPKSVWPLNLPEGKKMLLQERFLEKYCQLCKLDYQKTKKELNKYLIKIFLDQVYFFSAFVFEGWQKIDTKTKNCYEIKIKDLFLKIKELL